MKCPSNLRQIGQALQLYANDNKGFPRTYYDPTLLGSFKADFTGGAKASPSTNPFLPQPFGSVGANNTLAAMFLLVRTTGLNQEVFICPQAGHEKDTFTNTAGTKLTSKDVSNFTSAVNISYSFANPYPTSQGVGAGGRSPINLGYKWSPKVTADFAIAADRNDGFTGKTLVNNPNSGSAQSDQRQLNSRNHQQDGQNVLFNDGHVDWSQSAWVGANKDNIYTAAKTAPVGNRVAQSASNTRKDPDKDGQEVTFNDGRVEMPTTMWTGANKDNIYVGPGFTRGPTTTPYAHSLRHDRLDPATELDTILLPIDEFRQLSPAASLDTTTADPQIDLDTVLIPKF
ncbi:MAG: hypothetical protein ACHRHE_10815 [Tepidisphaerales bacterium]